MFASLVSVRYQAWIFSLLLLVLSLGESGCRSQQAAYPFAPGTGSYALSARPAASPTRPDSARRMTPVAGPAAVAVAPPRVRPGQRAQRPRPAIAAGLRVHRPPMPAHRPSARPAGLADKLPAERGLLLSGAGSTLLGLTLIYFGSNAASTGLLSLAHALLWLGGLLLAGWFVLLLLRASKE